MGPPFWRAVLLDSGMSLSLPCTLPCESFLPGIPTTGGGAGTNPRTATTPKHDPRLERDPLMPIPAAAGTDPAGNPPPIQGLPASPALATDPEAARQGVCLDLLASTWTKVHPFGNLHTSTPFPAPANAGPADLPAGASGALPRGGALLLVRTRARPPAPRIVRRSTRQFTLRTVIDASTTCSTRGKRRGREREKSLKRGKGE
jgi:hypothetical protein